MNLEYLTQVGATSELVLDHGWPPQQIAFERGEPGALALDEDDQVVPAMEAKARVAGPDSLEKPIATWLHLIEHPEAHRATNAGRKLDGPIRSTKGGPVLAWLVADRARWSLRMDRRLNGDLCLSPSRPVDRAVVLEEPQEEPMLETHPYDPSLHRRGTAAHEGHCSWHGPVSCPQPPVISFQDRSGDWQSGCQRAVDELTARGWISTPSHHGKETR